MQDRAPAGGASHEVIAVRGDLRFVDVGQLLMTPQADGGEMPAVKAQRGGNRAGRRGLGNGLVYGHVGRAGAGRFFDDQAAKCGVGISVFV